MEELVGNADHIDFYIETQLEEQIGLQPLPYPGMDKSGSSVCNFFLRGHCPLGATCPFRHIKADRSIVCKHWLRGLCKKGDDCEFLHEFDMSKMPECYFFTKFGQCLNKECPFLHIDPNSKLRECDWYDRGFCRNGPHCKNKHVRKIACVNFLNGFCVDGPECRFAHPKWALPGVENMQERKQSWVCHHCGERGHKIQFCFKLPEEIRREIMDQLMKKKEVYQQQQILRHTIAQSLATRGTNNNPGAITDPNNPQRNRYGNNFNNNNMRGGGRQGNNFGNRQPFRTRNPSQQGDNNDGGGPKPLSEVTCFKCGDKGHYANQCPKGHLAFLSKADQEELQQNQTPF